MVVRKIAATVILASLGVCAAAYLRDYSMPRAQAADAADIPFDDPAHLPFFNHQKFLTQRGENGITSENWQKLSQSDRMQALAKDEAYLSEKYKELSAKPALTGNESALFHAIWGQPNGSQVPMPGPMQGIDRPAPKPETLQKVLGTLPKKMDSFEGTSLYDGGRERHDSVSGAGNTRAAGVQTDRASVLTIQQKQARTLVVPPPPPVDDGRNKRSLPWFFGGASLIGAAAVFLGMRKKSAPMAAADDFDLDIRLSRAEGPRGPVLAGDVTDETCGPTCINTCRNTCDATCGATCWSTCGGGTCGGTCVAPTCASTCGDTCRATCEGTCSFTCKDTCPMTCNLPGTNYTCPKTCGC